MFYVGDVWIPKVSFNYLKEKLNQLTKENVNITLPIFLDSENLESKVRTYFQMDDFVYPFQAIVNSYGIPRYKEVNPGLFSIISFPFLFGIMFGDIGHGFLLLLFSLYIELNSEKIKNSDSVLNSLVKYRYILILMGFFSFFCGIIYNDFMSIPLTFFSSCYINDKKNGIAMKKTNCIYPIGIDPKWYAATNDLAFMNSFKMKWSVIIGVIQMTLGIILRGLNNLFFKDYLGFFFEFIPQIIFMLLLFGYMIALIFIKWGTDYSKNTAKAPSIITILMNLALKGGSVEGKPVWSSVKTEEETNKMFFYIALICIPIILLPKPLIIIYKNYLLKKKTFDFDNKIKQNESENENIISIEMSNINNNIMNENIKDEIEPLLENDELPRAEKEYDKLAKARKEQPVIEDIKHVKEETASDMIVHQIIETIEFVLGCVSNTASYLRLWALSLAHSQLSKVFFEKSLLGVAINLNFLVVIIGYFLFANITISVLMGMDLLEAFLHTLRLHWVEFQNKFYYADGTAFVPYSFNLLLEGEK
jgi:V-type H+-transporting ATPase subunit a